MSDRAEGPFRADQVRVAPANEASWGDLVAIFGTTGEPGRCQCQYFRLTASDFRTADREDRAARLRQQTGCDGGNPTSTTGLVAYADGEPAGWVAVEARSNYLRLRSKRVPWSGRDEDPDDDGVWAVTCFVVRRGFRGRGLSYHLARAVVEHARRGGARAVEAYPMIVVPGREITWNELYVGARQVFEEAGFEQVSHPTKRRVVMRLELAES